MPFQVPHLLSGNEHCWKSMGIQIEFLLPFLSLGTKHNHKIPNNKGSVETVYYVIYSYKNNIIQK